jgi:hypothetical protein
MRHTRHVRRCASLLALVACALVPLCPAQEAATKRRPASSLTSEDLLDRRVVINTPAPGAMRVAPSRAQAGDTAASTFYRDPTGAFTLNLPDSSWQFNAKSVRSPGTLSQRSFRRIEAEGFASATANIYVLPSPTNLRMGDAARLSPEQQKEVASLIAARFLSSNVSLVSVEASTSGRTAGLRIIADQMIARRVVVRASIQAFERQGQLFVVVCCAPVESFDSSARDFQTITESLAVSVTRSS